VNDKKIRPDKPRRWRVVVPLVAALAFAGIATWEQWPDSTPKRVIASMNSALRNPSLMGAASDSNESSATTRAPVVVATSRLPAALHAKDAEFVRLTAPDATPAMLSRAFEMAADCEREAQALAGGQQTNPQASQKCGLPPGKPDAATMRRMLAARVQRNDFGAWESVTSERAAFADDPQAWRDLVKEAWQRGIASAEPSVMAAEASSLIARGDALRSNGQADAAQAAYRDAAANAVASAIGVARENDRARVELGGTPKGNVDLDTNVGVKTAFANLTTAERKTAVSQGIAIAQRWKQST
jgi:hypothetical protein